MATAILKKQKEGHSLSVKVLHLSVKNGRLGTSTVDMPPCQSYLELDFKQIQNHSKLSKPQRSMCEREELPSHNQDLHRELSLATGCYRLPVGDCIKINTDGAAKGNPGTAGVGSTFRDSSERFLFVYNRKIDNTANYIATCSAILESTKEAVIRSWHSLWVETDFVAAGTAFNTGKVPCVAYANKVETTTGADTCLQNHQRLEGGQLICGSKQCDEKDGIASYEVRVLLIFSLLVCD
ncbi:hypothetical protein IFM89_030300 [Coptis chinensis]|uniref:RNase H type-1 domain-containing protein n=1 Tax=Coptis chinensis TaxID=261450 RepID=A0A835IVB4_9MAGN|nr:hypothetical protein IFM89_030300 [Coptis chinensis]